MSLRRPGAKPRKQKIPGKWVFIPANEKEAEQERMDQVMEGLALWAGGSFQHACAAVEQFTDYFPGDNKVPEGGAWVLVKSPPPCEYTVPPMSIWFAEPWPMDGEKQCSHRVKIVTPRGTLGLFPREYSRLETPAKYFEFIGEGMEIRFFGSTEGVPELPLFYLRSRGISKADAIALLIGEIKAHGVCWIESRPEVAAACGKEWPSDDRLATKMESD